MGPLQLGLLSLDCSDELFDVVGKVFNCGVDVHLDHLALLLSGLLEGALLDHLGDNRGRRLDEELCYVGWIRDRGSGGGLAGLDVDDR